jgi:hypothetical protein
MLIYVDIDDTICYYELEDKDKLDYSKAKPFLNRIVQINNLFEQGNEIVYWTSRGTKTGKQWFKVTFEQLNSWGCKFHELKMGKPSYDLFIDDKAFNSDTYFE